MTQSCTYNISVLDAAVLRAELLKLGADDCGFVEIDRPSLASEKAAILPTVSGRAWITGTHQHMLDPDDPWPEGYRLADTWPVL